MKSNIKTISPSSLDAFLECSLLYYYNYLLYIPRPSSESTLRGTLVHLIFELLLKPRHKKHFNIITINKDTYSSAPIKKLIYKKLEKDNILNDENIKTINEMILVGLKQDFFCRKCEFVKSEGRFRYEDPQGRFALGGIIDVLAKYENRIKIKDFKSSKSRHTKNKLECSNQALIYSLVSNRKFNLPVDFEFVFVRFPKKPIQDISFSKQELDGFERYLVEVYPKMQNFSENEKLSNIAVNNEYSWKCGGCKKGGWSCPYKNPFKYYQKEDNRRIFGSLKPFDGAKEFYHAGCECYNKKENDIW